MELVFRRRENKGKMATSFYRAPKPSVQYTNVITSTPTPSVSLGFLAQDKHMTAMRKHKPSNLINKEAIGDDLGSYDNDPNGNEVDRRAEKFISFVRERLRLERIEDGWRK